MIVEVAPRRHCQRLAVESHEVQADLVDLQAALFRIPAMQRRGAIGLRIGAFPGTRVMDRVRDADIPAKALAVCSSTVGLLGLVAEPAKHRLIVNV